VNAQTATDATLIHSAIVAVLATDGNGVRTFNEQLRKLNDG